MAFYEDERIRHKNRVKEDKPPELESVRFFLSEGVSLAAILEILNDKKFKVSLISKNVVIVE